MSGDWPEERLWVNNVDSVNAELLNQEIRDRMRQVGALGWSVYDVDIYHRGGVNPSLVGSLDQPVQKIGWLQGFYSVFGDLVSFLIVGNATVNPADSDYNTAGVVGWSLPYPAIVPGAVTGTFVNYIDQSIANTRTQADNAGGTTGPYSTQYARVVADLVQYASSTANNWVSPWPAASVVYACYRDVPRLTYTSKTGDLDDWNNSSYSSYYIVSGQYVRNRDEE